VIILYEIRSLRGKNWQDYEQCLLNLAEPFPDIAKPFPEGAGRPRDLETALRKMGKSFFHVGKVLPDIAGSL
jgi:hypothetical protein